MMPRVSIILPTHNRRTLLDRALASVWTQTFRDFELIVVDDASTDGTGPWLQSAGANLRVLTTQAVVGAAAARNLGVAQSRGDLVAFLDDDDVWRPSYLEAQVGSLDRTAQADLSYAAHVEIDPRGQTFHPDTQPLLNYQNPLMRLLTESFVHTLSVVVCRKSVFDRVGSFSPEFSIVHDLDWYARVLTGGGNFAHVPERLVERSVPGGLVTQHRRWFQEERIAIGRAFELSPNSRKDERRVRAYRALFFASLGFARGDVAFGCARLSEACLRSTHWTIRVAALRLLRRWRFGRQSIERLEPTRRHA